MNVLISRDRTYERDLIKLVDQVYTFPMEVTVQEAKTQLSKLLRRVEAGEEVTIRRGKVPVAVLVRAPAPAGERNTWGSVEGEVGPDFDAPLSDFAGFQ